MDTRYSVTHVGRYIGEVIDQTLVGDNIQVTRHGRIVAEFTSDLPHEGEIITISVTNFVATVGHWIDLVEDERKVLVLTRRDRPVVAIIPFESRIGGLTADEHRA